MEEWERQFDISTGELKAISDYAGLSILEVLDLPYSFFLLLRKDAWTNTLRQSEQGQEFLKTLWRLQQTKADTKAIRNFKERRK